eukprot:symbB.v1.2.023711.t1/scaffold2191.1/size86259/3
MSELSKASDDEGATSHKSAVAEKPLQEGQVEEVRVCGAILGLFHKGVMLLDEVDLLLDPLKSELNWPLGRRFPLDMTGQQNGTHRRPWGRMMGVQRHLDAMASAGGLHTVLLRSDGQAVTCGSNSNGQCSIPPLDEGLSYSQVSAGYCHTVLLRSDGQAATCGHNTDGQCDIPPLDEGLSYSQVSAGYYLTVLLRSDGQAVACGENSLGQCSIPPLDEGISYSQVSGGGLHTVFLRSDGQAVACGRNMDGQCNIPPLDEGLSYSQVSAGHWHTVLLRSDGQAVACGSNTDGQCSIPPLDEGLSYSQVSGGGWHTVLLRSDGQAVTCGSNSHGQCNIPPLDEGLSYSQVSAGDSNTVLLRSDGQAVACGLNFNGQCSIPSLRSWRNWLPFGSASPSVRYVCDFTFLPLLGKDRVVQVDFLLEDDAGVILTCIGLDGLELLRLKAQKSDRTVDVCSHMARELNTNTQNLRIVLPDARLLGTICKANPFATLSDVISSAPKCDCENEGVTGSEHMPGRREAQAALQALAEKIQHGRKELKVQVTPHFVLLSRDFYMKEMLPHLADWAALCVDEHLEGILVPNDLRGVLRGDLRFDQRIDTLLCSASRHALRALNLTLTWLHQLLPYILSKVHRVSYGLLTGRNLDLQRDGSQSRKLLAVPFVGKDTPSTSSEFSHPDVAIGFTILSYRLHGLRERDVPTLLNVLLDEMRSESTLSFHRRTACQAYVSMVVRAGGRVRGFTEDGRWIGDAKERANGKSFRQRSSTAGLEGPPGFPCHSKPPREASFLAESFGRRKLWPLELLDLSDPEQLSVVSEVLRFSPLAIRHLLEHHVFTSGTLDRNEMQLNASGQELAGKQLFGRCLGFSGTPNDLLLRSSGLWGFPQFAAKSRSLEADFF